MRRLVIAMSVLSGLVLGGQAGAAAPTGWTTYLYDNSRDNAAQDGRTFTAGTLHLSESWSFKSGAPIVSSPMVQGGYAYVPSWDGYLYALDLATHQLVWKRFLGTQETWDSGGGVSSPPAFSASIGSSGAVLVGGGGQETSSGKHLYFYALDARTGGVLWKTSVGDGKLDAIFDGPLYLNGNVYIGTAFSGSGASSDAPERKGMLFELEGQTGKILHKTNMAAPKGLGGAIWGSISASADGTRIFVPTGDGSNPRKQPLTTAIVAVNPTSLKVIDHWQQLSLQKSLDMDFGAATTVFPAGNLTLVGTPAKLGTFFALDAAHLKKGPIWRRTLGNTGDPTNRADDIESSAYATGSEYPDGATLYAEAPNSKMNGQIAPGGLYALNPKNGHLYWSAALAGTPYGGGVTVYDDTVISAVQVGGSQTAPPSGLIEVHSAADGHLLASLATPIFGFASPVVQDGTIYFGTVDGVFHAIGMTSG